MQSTVLLVVLGFVLGALSLAFIFWVAYAFLGFRIVQVNLGAGVASSPAPRPPVPPVAISSVIPKSAPAPGVPNLSRLQIDLYAGSSRVPLIYTPELPPEQLAGARPTMMDVGVSNYDRGAEAPVDPLAPFSLRNIDDAGTIMVGRGGHVRPDLPGFDVMPRILFEVSVRDGAFVVTARKSMQDAGVLQVKAGKESPKRVPSQNLNLRVGGVLEIRQEIPNFGGPKPSTWYFKISLCD